MQSCPIIVRGFLNILKRITHRCGVGPLPLSILRPRGAQRHDGGAIVARAREGQPSTKIESRRRRHRRWELGDTASVRSRRSLRYRRLRSAFELATRVRKFSANILPIAISLFYEFPSCYRKTRFLSFVWPDDYASRRYTQMCVHLTCRQYCGAITYLI